MTQKQMIIDFPLAHRDDPQTSYEAAEKMVKSGKLARQEGEVLYRIESLPGSSMKSFDFTAKELAKWSMLNYSVVQRRLSGLHRKGKIERTGEKRDCCCVWRLV